LDAAFPGLGDLVAGRDRAGPAARGTAFPDEIGSPYRDPAERCDAGDEGAGDVAAIVDAVASSDARTWLDRVRQEAARHGLAWLGGGVADAEYAVEGRSERIAGYVAGASRSVRAATSAVVALRVRDALLDAGDALQDIDVVADETGRGALVRGREEARRALANVARIAGASLDDAPSGSVREEATARAFAAQLSRADASIAEISGWLGLDRTPTLVGVEFAGAELERLGRVAQAALGAMPSDAEILERFVAVEAARR
jgi:hypothetical protein